MVSLKQFSPAFFWRQRVMKTLVGLLRVGVTPEELARALALGATLGLLPTVGTTTAACLLIGGPLRLNQVAAQLSNYAVTPIQILLILPFLRLGETVLGVDRRFPLSAAEIARRVEESGFGFTLELGLSVVHALVGWACVAPAVFALVWLASRGAIGWLAEKRRHPAGT
ncbi:MAG: DUF2062 domain-containing protein [Acidobacteria bacterium]|nr:MAG: DUF2062 domain-containing protein [Acidobacteriota bacterium]